MPKAEEKKPIVEQTRTASYDKTTSGTLRWAEDADGVPTVFRTIYLEKWIFPKEVKETPEDYHVEISIKVFKN